ncbi:EF-hand domain-containing protein [Gemmata sp. G18]|uniref:EF-hand domain-containing protein n=1 Tax=Gemmata palustris TaxID=2822762 RepID=A0ABS5BLH1_9BACT|nr:EF-hand domain-containing protein [Gemmata palustris]MBP3953743.1 EF-hand domain-containing protein [Gemmata palustris]
MIRVLATMVLVGAGAPLFAVDSPAPVELVLLAGDRPVRIELFAEVDGRSVGAAWDAAFDRLLAFYDANGDAALSEVEAARLPSAFGVRQVLWGQVSPQAGGPPPFRELDANGDKKVTPDELAAWYRRAGAGVTVGAGTAPGTDKLTAALVKALDADGDGRVTEKEFKNAPSALRKIDANDDELVTPGELVARAAYPGAAGTTRLAPPGAEPAPAPVFPALVLSANASNAHWASELIRRRDANADGALDAKESDFESAAFAKLDTDGNGKLSATELAGWRKLPADATWHLRLGASTGVKSGEGVRWEKGHVRLDLRADGGRVGEQVGAARKRFLAQFAAADADRDGVLTADEAAKPKPSPMRAVLATADRDGDGRLSEKELVAWLDLQDAFAAAHVLVSVLDLGPGLFEILDADHDGALAFRELRAGWDRLTAAGCVTNGALDRTKLPRQFVAVVSRGQPAAPLGRAPRPGPAWFKAMDRNGDGDVSRREFTGPADVFDKLDLDKDGLLSAEEASKTDPKK